MKYCEHADKETGLTFANIKTCAEAFEMRIDNAQKYDKELIDKGWIRLVEENNRIYRKVEAGWLPLTERQRQGKAENTEQEKAENIETDDFLNFRNGLENLLNFSESSYILGESPKFKELLLKFRKSYKEVLNQHLDQPFDQHTDQESAEQPAAELKPVKAKVVKPKTVKKKAEPLAELPEDFAITEKMRTWASEKTPHVKIDFELAEFSRFWRDIATRNHRRTMRGWVATWQNRMEKLEKWFLEKNGGTNAIIKTANNINGFRESDQQRRDREAKERLDTFREIDIVLAERDRVLQGESGANRQ